MSVAPVKKAKFTTLPEARENCQHLKTWPEFFDAIHRNLKTFEIRRADRPFTIGMTLVLHEYNPDTGKYTGRILERTITYITDWEQRPGFVVMAIRSI